jgi:hypothetical protein
VVYNTCCTTYAFSGFEVVLGEELELWKSAPTVTPHTESQQPYVIYINMYTIMKKYFTNRCVRKQRSACMFLRYGTWITPRNSIIIIPQNGLIFRPDRDNPPLAFRDLKESDSLGDLDNLNLKSAFVLSLKNHDSSLRATVRSVTI